MTPRSMTRPTKRRDREGERQGDDQRPVEQAGKGGADHLLDDKGGVGAEHDHLAMRHVDDAHDAEGDGEADRREQQHRSQRDAVPDVLAGIPQRQRRVDVADRRRRRVLDRALRIGLHRGEQGERVAIAARADQGDGSELVGLRPVGNKNRCRAGLFEQRFDVAHGFAAMAASSGSMLAASGVLNMVSAAAMRTAGSLARSVSVPSASRMTRRSVLLTLILVRSALAASAGFFAAQRVEQFDAVAAFVADEDRGIGLADVEIAFGQCGERTFDQRVASGGKLPHDSFGGRESRCQWRIWR